MYSVLGKSPDYNIYKEFTYDYIGTKTHEELEERCNNGHSSLRFIEKLFQLKPECTILDLGCGSGFMCRDILQNGRQAVGIDGWNIYQKYQLGLWKQYPNNFFHADISQPFHILQDGQPTRFDVITSWDCLEHIHTDGIPQVFNNIMQHSQPGTLLICSISTNPHFQVHRTIQTLRWWYDQAKHTGFIISTELAEYFRTDVVWYNPDFTLLLFGIKQP